MPATASEPAAAEPAAAMPTEAPPTPAPAKPEAKKATKAKPQHHEAAAKRKAKERQHVATKGGLTAGLPACATPGWYVQMGAFSSPTSIHRLAEKLRGLGYQAFCIGPEHPNNLQLFYVGAYINAEAARTARDKLQKQTGTRGILRRVSAK